MGRFTVIACAVLALLSARFTFADDKKPEDVLKDKGLVKVGITYLLEGEVKLPESLRNMRMAKKKLDDDTKKRVTLENQIKMAKGAIAEREYKFRNLNEKLSTVKDAFQNNQIVGQLNVLQSEMKEAMQYKDDREAELKKTTESREEYVNAVMELSEKLDLLEKQYEAIKADEEVKTAIAALNAKPGPKFKLGPNPDLAANVQFVSKQRATINSAIVQVNTEGHVPHVDVTFNGKVTRSLVLDSGASVVSLTADTAKALNMVPGPNDPTIHLQLADGKVVEAKQMMIKSVRVGQFTVENVECAVLPESLVAAENLLGGSFLQNFVYKLDPVAGELHMSQIGGKVNPLDAKTPATPDKKPGGAASEKPADKNAPEKNPLDK